MGLREFERMLPPLLRSPLTGSQLADVALRYGATLGKAALIVSIISHLSLTPPLGGVLSMGTILVCAWFGGLGPALLLPVLVLFLSRLQQDEPLATTFRSPQELLAFAIITTLCVAIGLAGSYRRRIKAVTRRHHEKLRDQARALSVAHIVFREFDGRITQWSEGAQRMFGWAPDDVLGRRLHEVLETRYPQPRRQIDDQLLQTGQWEGEVIHHARDGTPLIVATHWILYRDRNGNPIGVAEVHNDISNLRRAEEAVREADRRKDRFLAMLAHELRNPLAPLRTALDLLQLTGANAQEDLEIYELMNRQLEQMVRLINDLLDVSRINTGKISLSLSKVALADVVRDAVEGSQPHIDAQGHKFSVSIPAEPILLNLDRARISQVLTNLLNNSAKFTPVGGTISLTAQRTNNFVEICIRDSGTGIDPQVLPTIFEMFAQADDLLVRSHGGLGIGLSIARTLVELHGGSIEARSEGLGLGSEFLVRLPAPAETSAPAGEPPTSRETSISLPAARRILVVDDNRDAARTLTALLAGRGYECQTAFEGTAALDVAHRFLPDIFLLDIGMPGMSGYDLARRLRALPEFRKATLIAVTGWGKEEDRQQTQAAGFNYHLVKPVDLAVLNQILQNGQSSG